MNDYYVKQAARSRRGAKVSRVFSTVFFILAAAFLAWFLFQGLTTGRWAWIMLTSIAMIASSAFSMLLSARSGAETARRWDRLAGRVS